MSKTLQVLRDFPTKVRKPATINSPHTPHHNTASLYIPFGDFARSPLDFFYTFLPYNWKPRLEKFSKIITNSKRSQQVELFTRTCGVMSEFFVVYPLSPLGFASRRSKRIFEQKFEEPLSHTLYVFTAYSARRFFSEPCKTFLWVFTV